MNLNNFLNLQTPAEYDFKLLMEEYYREKLKEIEALKKSPDLIRRWYLYRTLDALPFDCDGYNGACSLTVEIYQILWPEQVKSSNFGGDTMNSFAHTFGNYVGGSYRKAYSLYCGDNRDLSQNIRTTFEEYARQVSCLGNFCLVPLGYNRYRGDNRQSIRDYWDLSLDNLKYNKDHKDWLDQVSMSFKQYISTFFLWDYVEKDFKVVPLFKSHGEKMGPGAPYPYQSPYPERTEFRAFTSNANIRILRRGIFMVAMLRIATDPECGDDYENRIVPILSADDCPETMTGVLDKLKGDSESVGLSSKAIDILRQIRLPDVEKKI